jgi:hypothetical protein
MNTRHSFAPLLLLLVGCRNTPPPPAAVPPPTALTLEEWRTLPVDVKHDGATYERLRLQHPQLQHERTWQVWFNQNVLPERTKDNVAAPGQQPP